MRLFKIHPLLKLVNSYVVDSPQPSNLSYWWNFGSLLAFSLIIQIITGVTLAMHYNTDILEAFNSVEHIMRDINNGWLIRYLHSNTASAFFFIVYLHIGRGLYYGSYKLPRTLVWTIGTVLFISMIGTAFLGYVLPYGQMSLWGATVITSLMSAIPWVGQDIVEFIWGGFSVNGATLNRFFALHFVLPFILAALALMHLIVLHERAGSGNPLGLTGNSDRLPFAPYFIFKDLITIFIFILVLSIFVFYMPNILGDSENYVMANPMQTPSAIVPEWYLLPFYAILRSIPNKLLGVIAMFSAIIMLLVMSITDLSRSRGIQFKPLSKMIFFIFVGNFLALTQLGAEHVESPFIEFGQISTILYFTYFFIIIPSISLFENGLGESWLEEPLTENNLGELRLEEPLTKNVYNSISAKFVKEEVEEEKEGEEEKKEEYEYIVPSYAVTQSFLWGPRSHDEDEDDEDDDQNDYDGNDDDGENENDNDENDQDDDQSSDSEDGSSTHKTWSTTDNINDGVMDGLITDEDDPDELDNKDDEMERQIQMARGTWRGADSLIGRARAENGSWTGYGGHRARDAHERLSGNRSVNPERGANSNAETTTSTTTTVITNNDTLTEVNTNDTPIDTGIEIVTDRVIDNNNTENNKYQAESPGSSKKRERDESYDEKQDINENSKKPKYDNDKDDEGYLPTSECDAPRPWEVYFQDSGTPQVESLQLHDNTAFYLVIILFKIAWLLVNIIKRNGNIYEVEYIVPSYAVKQCSINRSGTGIPQSSDDHNDNNDSLQDQNPSIRNDDELPTTDPILLENQQEYALNVNIYNICLDISEEPQENGSDAPNVDKEEALRIEFESEDNMAGIRHKCEEQLTEKYRSAGLENPEQEASRQACDFTNKVTEETYESYTGINRTDDSSENIRRMSERLTEARSELSRFNADRQNNSINEPEGGQATQESGIIEQGHNEGQEDTSLPTSECDAPRPWGIYFQDSGTPQMEALIELHDNIAFYLVIILFGVGWLLVTIINKFGEMASPLPQKFATHGTSIEIIWTVTPAIILILIAFPSFKLLYLMDEISDPVLVILAEGHQWYWSYQYSDFINDDDELIQFDSYLIPESDLEDGALRMLEVDNRITIPELTHTRFVFSGADVIHSFACPALGLKCDAYPGRLNQSSLVINRPSTYYGQCSEICGILHSSMPIVFEAVSAEKFVKWLIQQ